MKEILKYLRQLNNFSQKDIAKKIGISRQSYSKYENGSVLPNEKILQKLAKVYNVQTDFIKANKIPSLSKSQNASYIIDENFKDDFINEPKVSYSAKPTQTLQGIFDGVSIRILDSIEKIQQLGLNKGQKIKFYIEDFSDENEKNRQNAIKTIEDILKNTKPCTLPMNEDPYYKEQLKESLLKKYELTN